MKVSELDSVVGSVGLFPVRTETLAEAWDLTSTARDRTALPGGQVLLMVTMRARSSYGPRFEAAARDFVHATAGLQGSLGSTLHQSPGDKETWFLIERFASREALEQHMASDYFRRFQLEQQTVLVEPVRALFLEPATENDT